MYHRREWLNKEDIYASSTITAYHGMSSFLGENNNRTVYENKKLAIHDCQQFIRIHQMADQTDQEYIDKIRLIAEVCLQFAEHLQTSISDEGVRNE